MRSRVHEHGSVVHIVIIVILVLALLGALGFIFWKNVTKGDAVTAEVSQSDDVNSDTEETSLVEKSFMSSDNFGITYSMPSTWTGGAYGGGDTLSDSESTTLVAPDGFTVTLSISRLVRGWTAEDPTSKILEVQKTMDTDLTWVTVEHANGSSGPISLQISNIQTTPSVGDQKVVGSSIYKLGEVDGSGVYLEIYGEYKDAMSFEDFNAKASVKEAKALFESVKFRL